MSEDLFQQIALGLLVVLVVVLVVIAIQLARLRVSLRQAGRTEEGVAPGTTEEESIEAGPDAAAPVMEDAPAPEAVGPSSNGESEAVPPAAAVEGGAEISAVTSEARSAYESEADVGGPTGQPFERDGRWWFERDGELLVYDERSGQWMPEESDPIATAADAEPSLQPEWEPVATSEPEVTPEPVVEPEPMVEPVEPEPVSQMDPDPTPVAATPGAEEKVHPLDEPRPDGAPFVTTAEPVSEEPAKPAASFWKCPSCGVVNGSTAHLCRMCFTARP